MSKTNSQNGWKAATDYAEIEVSEGDMLSRPEIQSAYFRMMYQESEDEECKLASDEIIRIFNAQDISGLTSDDAEEQMVEAMRKHQHGEAGEDVVPQMDIGAAIARKADAQNYGAKLPKEFNEHLRRWLDSSQFKRMGCVFCADDVAGRLYNNHDSKERNWKGGAWSRDELAMMPVPGTKPAKGVTIDDSNRHQYDTYKYEASDGTKITSSWFLDAVIATEEGSILFDELSRLEDEKKSAVTASDETKKQIEAAKTSLNDCATFLRDGVTVAKAIIEFERLGGKIIWEVQRDDDGLPAIRSKRPLRVWPQGQSGKAEAFTLSNMRTMLKVDGSNDNAVDRCIANGGTWDAWKKHGMPEKVKGKKKTAHVSTPLEWLNWQDACSIYVQRAGVDGLIRLLLDKDKNVAQGNVATFGTMMQVILPVWERPDVQEVWQAFKTEQRKKDAAKKAA